MSKRRYGNQLKHTVLERHRVKDPKGKLALDAVFECEYDLETGDYDGMIMTIRGYLEKKRQLDDYFRLRASLGVNNAVSVYVNSFSLYLTALMIGQKLMGVGKNEKDMVFAGSIPLGYGERYGDMAPPEDITVGSLSFTLALEQLSSMKSEDLGIPINLGKKASQTSCSTKERNLGKKASQASCSTAHVEVTGWREESKKSCGALVFMLCEAIRFNWVADYIGSLMKLPFSAEDVNEGFCFLVRKWEKVSTVSRLVGEIIQGPPLPARPHIHVTNQDVLYALLFVDWANHALAIKHGEHGTDHVS